jgi:hypothetical protein
VFVAMPAGRSLVGRPCSAGIAHDAHGLALVAVPSVVCRAVTRRDDWAGVRGGVDAYPVVTFCLVLACVIWYSAKLGATRTSAYSSLTPIAAMVVAWL